MAEENQTPRCFYFGTRPTMMSTPLFYQTVHQIYMSQCGKHPEAIGFGIFCSQETNTLNRSLVCECRFTTRIIRTAGQLQAFLQEAQNQQLQELSFQVLQ